MELPSKTERMLLHLLSSCPNSALAMGCAAHVLRAASVANEEARELVIVVAGSGPATNRSTVGRSVSACGASGGSRAWRGVPASHPAPVPTPAWA
jgi:hypothetical protein